MNILEVQTEGFASSGTGAQNIRPINPINNGETSSGTNTQLAGSQQSSDEFSQTRTGIEQMIPFPGGAQNTEQSGAAQQGVSWGAEQPNAPRENRQQPVEPVRESTELSGRSNRGDSQVLNPDHNGFQGNSPGSFNRVDQTASQGFDQYDRRGNSGPNNDRTSFSTNDPNMILQMNTDQRSREALETDVESNNHDEQNPQTHIRNNEMTSDRDTSGLSWSSWSEWSGCSDTCGGGSRYRWRECQDEAQELQYGCQGDYLMLDENCNSQPCLTQINGT